MSFGLLGWLSVSSGCPAILSGLKTLLETGEGCHRLGELYRRAGQLTDVWVHVWAS